MPEQTPDEKPDNLATIELKFDAETKGGQTHPLFITFQFPQGKGLIAATALQQMMDSTIGPAFMEALHESGDESMLAFLASIGFPLNGEN